VRLCLTCQAGFHRHRNNLMATAGRLSKREKLQHRYRRALLMDRMGRVGVERGPMDGARTLYLVMLHGGSVRANTLRGPDIIFLSTCKLLSALPSRTWWLDSSARDIL